jgi:fucose 4-O-acetylase-like acetyltransferase
MASRIRYFDIAKGVAILCVILGHSILRINPLPADGSLAAYLYHFCFTFHMPLFFILSGYFMHPERPFRGAKESKELLATYGITSLTVVALSTLLAWSAHTGGKLAFQQWMTTALYGAGATADNFLWPVPASIGAIWFLLALFWAHLLMHTFAPMKGAPLWIALIFCIGYFSARVFWFPVSIQSGMTATLFVYIGYVARQGDVLGFLRHHRYLWIVPFAVWGLFFWEFSGFSMAVNQYGQRPLLALVGSFCATLGIVGICMVIDKAVPPLGKGLSLVGQYTLPILCIHLVEDSITPWGHVIPRLDALTHGVAVPYVIFAVRTIIDLLLTWGLYHVPKVNMLFFPSLAKQQREALVAAAPAAGGTTTSHAHPAHRRH